MTLEHLFNARIETSVDFVFVIDATNGMTTLIETIEKGVHTFYENIIKALDQRHRALQKLRVKVIWFRDFYFDGQYAYGESQFFELPEENEEFRKFVASIRAAGGGDDPESALEALTLAMRSDFTQAGDRRRHIIVLFTDQSAHAFEDYDQLVEKASAWGCKPVTYPINMPKSLVQLYDEWNGYGLDNGSLPTKLDKQGKRLLLVTPDAYPWEDMEMDLEQVLRMCMLRGDSCEDFSWDNFWELLNLIL